MAALRMSRIACHRPLSRCRILHALTEYADSGTGDVKALAGEWQGHFRLRVADYRVIFTIAPEEITIIRVRHRSEIYR